MSHKRVLYLMMIMIWLCSACGLKENVVQKAETSFISFTGDIQNAVVYIDALEPFTLNEDSKNINYEIQPGKHTIIVKKSDKEVVNRKILLGNGITKEIRIP